MGEGGIFSGGAGSGLHGGGGARGAVDGGEEVGVVEERKGSEWRLRK